MYLRYNAPTPSATGPKGSLTSTVLPSSSKTGQLSSNLSNIYRQVIPSQGFTLQAKWGAAAKELVDSGALNVSLLGNVLQQSGQQLTPEELSILNGTSTTNITINATDAPFVLDLLWAIGINNNNTIINNGPLLNMSVSYADRVASSNTPNKNFTPYYIASKYFASTGGYAPLGRLSLGRLDIIKLTPAQQGIANYVAINTYRPCCDNPTAMPDCNHGAAALGLVELMAAQGFNQSAIFNGVRDFNSMEFPGPYVITAEALALTGGSWNSTPSNTILSAGFSSASGFSQAQKYVASRQSGGQQVGGGSGCGA